MAHNLQELADMAGKYGFMILGETGNSSETMVVLNIIKENLHTARTMEAVKKEFGLKNVEKPFDKELEDTLTWYEEQAEKRASESVKRGQTTLKEFCKEFSGRSS